MDLQQYSCPENYYKPHAFNETMKAILSFALYE